MFHLGMTAAFQNVQVPHQVSVCVRIRVFQRVAHPGPGGRGSRGQIALWRTALPYLHGRPDPAAGNGMPEMPRSRRACFRLTS